MKAVQTGSTIKVTYQEPTTNSDGTPLEDLERTEVTADWGAGPQVVATVPASAATGGAEQSPEFVVPAVDGVVTNVSIFANAFDIRGNKSQSSEVIAMSIDLLAPAAPI